MKISLNKNQLINLSHLVFWFLSLNAWTVVFNPGVDSTNWLYGIKYYWSNVFLLNGTFCLYGLMPFIWRSKKSWMWLKVFISVLFVIPIALLVFRLSIPGFQQFDVDLIFQLMLTTFGYTLCFHLTIVAAMYANLKVLIPRFLIHNRYLAYLGLLAVLIVTSAIVNYALFNEVIDKLFPMLYYISYFNILELVIITTAYLLFTVGVFMIWQYFVLLIANRQKAQHELLALKAQINPHFLFNNLNTIYSMASRNDQRTKEVILKLSDFLRYVLYDTSNPTIPLEKEVEIIKKYVDLQRERVNPAITEIDLTLEGDFANLEIAPLLLLPLAENCFKHGIGNQQGKITIHIGIREKQLIFTTENVIALREKTGEKVSGGIGIKNVENRLDLLYPNRHRLHFQDSGGIFKVRMTIDL